MVASRLATLSLGSNQHVEISTPSQSDAAKPLNVSTDSDSVQFARKVLDQGSQELIAKLIMVSLDLSISTRDVRNEGVAVGYKYVEGVTKRYILLKHQVIMGVQKLDTV